ncbi:MAG: sulfate ABC transporter permease subunit CysT [Candidatus Eisenbacteria sp.]|nr:sulfate ABC transporter permease subunit CysT [Candidatus Eisenbacteria bacterium]
MLRGISLSYLGLFVALPIAALTVRACGGGIARLWVELTRPEALFSLQLTLAMAGAMIVVNVLMGTLTAWVLVRYRFPGQSVINALIDLPFAIPTVVTGLMLVMLYGPQSAVGSFLSSQGIEIIYAKPGIVLALLFVTSPFVVRAVQPVLMEMDQDMEEAAATLGASQWTVFRKVIIPSILPAVLTGAALSFSRALGEFGSVVMVAGNIPMRTQVAPVFIYGEVESDNPLGALGVSLVLLAGSLTILVLLNLLQRMGRKRDD